MKNIQPSTSSKLRFDEVPYPFVNQFQYQRFLNCLDSEKISLSASGKGFTAEQLRCAAKVLGTCPPGYQSRCENLNIQQQVDTPILSPAPGVNPSDARNTSRVPANNSNLRVSGGSASVFRSGQYSSSFGTSELGVTASNAQKTYMPSSFVKSKQQLISREQYGFVSDLDNNRFVSDTAQRISGGYVVPLAQPLQTASRTPRPIRNIELQNQPWAQSLQSLNNLSDTASSVRVSPKRIGSKVNLGQRTLNNVVPGAKSIDPQQGAITNSTFTGPAFDQPNAEDISGSTIDARGNATATGKALSNLEENLNTADRTPETSVIDTENIRFNSVPQIEITPLVVDDSGDYVPAGRTASATLARPTPEYTITGESMLGIPENSEIYFNGQKVIIRGSDPQDIATQVNCANINLTARTTRGAGGQPDVVISSCDGSPWTVANGCAGGRYKQVGDFHINRGFEQQTNLTSSTSVTNNATVIPASLSSFVNENGTGQRNPFQVIGANGNPVLQTAPEGTELPTRENYIRYFATPDGEGPGVTSLIPQDTQTLTENRVFSTGGSGYRIGDRLRLVGGTPVNSSKAPLSVICIDSAGAGYTDPANLEVVINSDGNAPGLGAAATVTELDELGGIASIEIVNQGAGYDVQNPPTIEIRDRSPATQSLTDISAAWPEEVTLDGGSIIRILAEQDIEDPSGDSAGQRAFFTRFVRTTAPIEFGTSQTYTKTVSRSGNLSDTDIGAYFQEDTGNFALVLNQRFTELDENVRRFSYIGISVDGGEEQLYWIPNVITFSDVEDVYPNFEGIITPESSFTSQAEVEAAFPEGSTVTIRVKTPWWKNLVPGESGERPTLVDTVDPRLQKVPAQLSAKIGIRPDAVNNPDSLSNADSAFLDGYSGLAGPLRVAKFIVTAVDSEGGITALRVIDRGLYKIFPSDLTYGIPLEYDYEAQGLASLSESGTSIDSTQRYRLLGVGDPARDNIGYGPGHPEYQSYPFAEGDTNIRYVGPESLTPVQSLNDTVSSGTTESVSASDSSSSDVSVNSEDRFLVFSAYRSNVLGMEVWYDNNEPFPPFREGVQVSLVTEGNTGLEYKLTITGVGRITEIPDPRFPSLNRIDLEFAFGANGGESRIEEMLRVLRGLRKYLVFSSSTKSARSLSVTEKRPVTFARTSNLTETADCEGIQYGRLSWNSSSLTATSAEADIPSDWTGTSLAVGDRIAFQTTFGDARWYEGRVTKNDSGKFGWSVIGNQPPNLAAWANQYRFGVIIGEHCLYSTQDVVEPPPPPVSPPPVSPPPGSPPVSPPPGQDDTLDPENPDLTAGSRFFTPAKHPNWAIYPEFYWDGQRYQVYEGSPGDYDPSTFVIVDTDGLLDEYGDEDIPQSEWPNIASNAADQGKLLRKIYRIDRNPLNESTFGQYAPGRPIAGGTGARLFLTSEEVPDCSEKSTAKESLGMPDVVDEINAPNVIARALNDALQGAGYAPEDIEFSVNPVGDLSEISLNTPFDGIQFDSPTPGFLEKLGIPPGTYNTGILCLEGEIANPDLTNEQALALVRQLYDDPANNLGVLDNQRLADIVPNDPDALNDPSYVLNLLCISRLGRLLPQPNGGVAGPINDNNSVFSDALPSRLQELYRYDIVNLYGESVTLSGSPRQQSPVNIFESKRFNDANRIENAGDTIGLLVDQSDSSNVTVVGSQTTLENTALNAEANAWVDNYQGQGWAYLENGVVQQRQEPLVDIKAIEHAQMYNAETGQTSLQLNFWDPFKGVLPGFIQNEIHFISDEDPVSYNNARTMFGKNTVGKVWWDTSTVRYEWYEQGTNQQRRDRWGRAFPGSSITVCEWVESTALPVNWNGNGIPRWTERYITERRQDPDTGEYQLYYYYWVQNRSVIDDRIARRWNRKWDTQTIARYISNPVGYGISLINFVSTDGITVNNVKNSISDDDHHLQVNFDRNLNPNGLKHTAWKLMRDGDSSSTVPEHLSDKLIDSLCGENALGQPVPDPSLSVVERVGIKFRPRQSMFRDVKSARRVMTSTLNRILDNTKIRSEHPNWDVSLPAQRTYVQTRNWYAVLRTDPTTNEQILYDDSYKPVLNVDSVSDLFKLVDLPDGTVVQVIGSTDDNNQLWQYIAREQDFRQISIFDETVALADRVFTDDSNATLATELRLFLVALRDVVFDGTELWNTFFFEMVKHAHMEQQQLDWAFKTTFLYVDKEEEDLVKFTGFKADNFQKVLDYMNEVKPYSAKIREYKDTKRAPLEIIGQNNISDYDKPPYADASTGEVRSLNTRDVTDWQIMSADSRYIDYFTALADGDTTPLRKATTRLVFDRTHWQPTELDWNPLVTTINQSMANNMAALNSGDVAESEQRAIDRIFLHDSEVRTVFANEVNIYYSDPEDFDSVITDSDKLLEMLEAGQLNRTLAMLKEKVGGGWRGEILDANGFNSFLDSTDYINEIITEFGFDSEPWDENSDNDIVEQNVVYNESAGVYTVINGDLPGAIGIGDQNWDSVKQVVDYEGVFNTDTQGNVTLVRNGELYEGFDGVTFQRVLYGEERPEEMAVFGPLENLIITVRTEPYALGLSQQTIVTETSASSDIGSTEIIIKDINIVTEDNNVLVTEDGTFLIREFPALSRWVRVSSDHSEKILGQIVEVNKNNNTITIDRPLSMFLDSNVTITISSHINVAPSAETISYRIHENLFGGTDYLRISNQASTVLAQPLGSSSSVEKTVLQLADQGSTVISVDNVFDVLVNSWIVSNNDQRLGKVVAVDIASNTITLNKSLTTSLSANSKIYVNNFGNNTSEIVLDDGSFLPDATTQDPGAIWIGTELVYYGYRNGNTLSLLTRGALGTTIQDHTEGTAVYSADESETFNHLNPRANIWLDVGRVYEGGDLWDEGDLIGPGPDGEFGSPSNVSAYLDDVYDTLDAWDEIANSNITVTTVDATVESVSNANTVAEITLTTNLPLEIDEPVRVAKASNANIADVVRVSNIDGSNITVAASYAEELDTSVFVANANITVSAFEYGTQANADYWDAANVLADTALSLSDRANADFTASSSIMRFLHRL